MVRTIAFAAFSGATGLPMAGAAPSWASYVSAADGSNPAKPAVTELGGGLYRTSIDDNCYGVIAFAASGVQSPAIVVPCVNSAVTSAVTAALAPVAGPPVWSCVYDTKTGQPVSPQPTFTQLGSNTGIFRIDGLTPTMAGIVDWGSTANPRFQMFGVSDGFTTLPVSVTHVSPPAGTAVTPSTPLVFEVDADPNNNGLALVAIFAAFPGLPEELVYDGAGFGPVYTGSVAPTASGQQFTLIRTGGWPASPQLTVRAVDGAGNGI